MIEDLTSEEKQALLRLRIKVYLGLRNIPHSNVWDEPVVYLNGKKADFQPDLIAVQQEGIWFLEMKAWKRPVTPREIQKIFENKIEKIHKADVVKFVKKDGKRETEKNLEKVSIVSGEGGFSGSAYTLGKDYGFDMKESEELGVEIVKQMRISQDDKLLGVAIFIVPKGSKETLVVPEEIIT